MIIILWLIIFLQMIFKFLIKIAWLLSLNLISLIFYFSLYVKKNYPSLSFYEILFNIILAETTTTKNIIFSKIVIYAIIPTALTGLIILLINENIRKNIIENKNLILSIKKNKNNKLINLIERNKDYILKFNLFKKIFTIKIRRKVISLALILANLSFISFCIITSIKNLKIEEYLKNLNF